MSSTGPWPGCRCFIGILWFGRGHLYQGRFKSFPIQEAWARRHGSEEHKAIMSDWPMERPRNLAALVNQPMTEKEAEGIRLCIARNRPCGDERWQEVQPERLGLTHTLRNDGRPKAIRNASEG